MPKIIIREYDKTQIAPGAYTNFTVLVPGFIGTPAEGYKPDFDENDVVEFGGGKAEQERFINEIGKVELGFESVEYAKPDVLDETKEEGIEKYTKLMEFVDFVEYEKQGKHLYSLEAKGPTDNEGHLFAKLGVQFYKFTLITPETFEVGQAYAVIAEGNEGHDKVETVHYGNQMAYELIRMGYNVLFKKLGTETDDTEVCIAKMNEAEFWKPFYDKANYDFRYVIPGLLNISIEARTEIIKLVELKNLSLDKYNQNEGRGDCIALIDVPETEYNLTNTQAVNIENIKNYVNTVITDSGKNVAFFAPYVCFTAMSDIRYENKKFPCGFYYLACAAYAKENGFAEWYAVSGYDRGICKYKIESLGCKLGDAGIQALQPRTSENKQRPVNLAVKIKNAYYLWGNRTAVEIGNELIASDFLNIRQLCTTLKKQIYVACRRFTFDPNSDVLWTNFCSAIVPTLERMKADQGIEEYRLERVPTEKKALLRAKIRIIPIEAVEDFEINCYLENSINGEVEFDEGE